MISDAIEKIKQVGYDRCGSCPAHWASTDYWGESDEGCTLHRDHLEFCPLSLLPKFVMKPYVKLKEHHEEEYWENIYKQEFEKWEQEEATQDQSQRRNDK